MLSVGALSHQLEGFEIAYQHDWCHIARDALCSGYHVQA
jgi:hypothetical protein